LPLASASGLIWRLQFGFSHIINVTWNSHSLLKKENSIKKIILAKADQGIDNLLLQLKLEAIHGCNSGC